MDLLEYSGLDAVGIAELIAKGDVTAKEMAELACRGIEAVNPALNAVIEVFQDRLDGPDPAWSEGPLFGVPMLNKDLSFAEAGRKQEMGSIFAKGFKHSTDSTIVERLRKAGINLIGRTTTPEFGNAGITESRIAGVTRNPWDPERTPGGSSGGSAAIVAAGAVPVATASDGGGSTRTPASVCGLVGLKPTRGLIPVGPARGEGGCGLTGAFAVTRSMRDCAMLLDVMSGPSPGDPYMVRGSASYSDALLTPPSSQLRIAFCEENWAGVPTSEPSRQALRAILGPLLDAGHFLEEASPGFDWDVFFEATTTVMCANIASGVETLSRAFGRRPESGELQASTWGCYEHGKSISATDLLSALGQFNDISRSVGVFFERYDLLATPTNVFPPPRLDECYSCDPSDPIDGPSYQRNVYSNDHFVCLANMTGQPSITLPVYETEDGLPLGVQLIGRHCAEDLLMSIGQHLETALSWSTRRPQVHVSGR